jgi:hypothetical protein
MLTLANAENSVRASQSGNRRRQKAVRLSLKPAGLNGKERSRVSWKNGNSVKTAISPSASGVLTYASVASMRYVSTKSDSVFNAAGRRFPAYWKSMPHRGGLGSAAVFLSR